MKAVWLDILGELGKEIDERDFDRWLAPIKLIQAEENTFRLEVPSKFHRQWFMENYQIKVLEKLNTRTGQDYRIEMNVVPDREQMVFETIEEHHKKKAAPRTPSQINPRYTFDHFITGPSNQFAHAASRAVADNPGRSFNPLFIYGGTGLGKTHLLSAIGNRVVEKTNGETKILLMNFDRFMNEMINAVQHKRIGSFRNKYRERCDVLLMDDIQFLSNKERTQEEFFHIFNILYDSSKQIVLTADKFPREIPNLEERLRSRFEWGLIADIQPPELETRVAILKDKAEQEDIELPEDIAFFLAKNFTSNIRALEGALIRIGAFSSLQNEQITLDLAKEVLKDMIHCDEKAINIESIQKEVAGFFSIKVSDMKSKRKHKEIAIPRQVAMYLCRNLTDSSYPEIGSKFGGKDHATVIHAVKRIEKKMKEDKNMQRAVETLTRIIMD